MGSPHSWEVSWESDHQALMAVLHLMTLSLSTLYCVEGRMKSNDIKGSGCGLIYVISWYFPQRTRNSSRIAGVFGDLGIECFLNKISIIAIPKFYRRFGATNFITLSVCWLLLFSSIRRWG
jgi:hypothetical protein